MSSSPRSSETTTNYFPTEAELSTPRKARMVLQQVLRQHYELVKKHEDLLARVAAIPTTPPPANNGATNTVLLGLPVTPIDTNSLANGATLKWDKASGSFKFS